MSLTVLGVAFPFAPAGPDSAGGAEQVLGSLDAALVRAGHRSIVVAAEGSVVRGTLHATEIPGGPIDEESRRLVHRRHRNRIEQAIDRCRPDVVHMHGIDFHRYLPAPGVPVLVTLHLPPSWYPPEVFRLSRPDTWLHCVSASQRRQCPESTALLSEICNGVDVDRLPVATVRRSFALTLGRICPEKSFHEALEAGKRAGIPILLAGFVYPYEEHERYFREKIVPSLDRERRFIGPVGFHRKRRLLSAARCLLVPSRAPETSSLVAMEAFACGTPVIAFRSGALPEIIDHGVTGFLVGDAQEMADAIGRVGELDPETIRRIARERFSLDRMVKEYFDVYRKLSGS